MSGPGRILVVDDDKDILSAMEQILRMANHDVKTAPTGDQAWRLFKDNGVAAVVTDYRMPGMDGLELADKVHQARPELPIIMVTAYNDEHLERQAAERGVAAIIRKPFDLTTLVDTVAEALA